MNEVINIGQRSVGTAPTDITLSANTIAENNSINDVIGAFSDDGTGSTSLYTLVAGTGDTDNASFNIDGSNLRASEVFDVETKDSYSIRVRATNDAGNFEEAFTITITNIAAAVNTVAPVVSGDAVEGSVLTTTDGTWTGDSLSAPTYQWRKDGVDIGGETTNTYTSVNGDIGSEIDCEVTRGNSEGDVTAVSNAITVTAIPLEEPELLSLTPISTTELRAYAPKISGATSYRFEYDTDSGFSAPTLAQNTSSNICNITGLTIDTLYYVRVRAEGLVNSNYVSASKRTIPFMPEAWYEIAGIEPDTDNAFGDASGGSTPYDLQTLKSIVNTSGPSIALGTQSVLRAVNFEASAPEVSMRQEATYTLTGDTTADKDLSAPVTLTGDFTIAWRSEHPELYRTLLGDLTSNSYIVFNTNGQVRCYIDNTQYNYTFGTFADTNIEYDWVIRRTGTLLEISNDGGTTWNTMSASAKTNDFVISSLGLDAAPYGARYFGTLSRLVFVDEAVSDANLDYINNYLKADDFVSSDIAITDFEGLTFSAAPAGNAIVGSGNLAIESGMTRRTWMVLNEGDYTLMSHHTNENSPNFYRDYIYILKHSTGEIATIELPASTDENHLYGGVFKFNGRIVHMEPNAWYDLTNTTDRPNYPIMRLFDRASGNKADLNGYEDLTRFNGLYKGISRYQAYYGFFDNANIRYLFSAGNQPSGGQRHLQLNYSTDYINHWLFNRILDSGTTDLWPYPFYFYHAHGSTEIIIGVNVFDRVPIPFKYGYAGLIRVDLDGKTVRNFDGTFSKDVSNNNYLSWSEFNTNFVFETRTSGEVRIGNAHYDDAGEMFLICGDGATDGQYKFVYGTPGGSLTEKSIDFGGRVMVTSGSAEGGYIHKTGANAYDVYLLADNSGDWQVWKFSTDDKGDTWTDEGAVSLDNTKRHAFITGTANQVEATNITLSYLRIDDEGAGVANGEAAYVYHDITV